jgi:hypothetical protein
MLNAHFSASRRRASLGLPSLKLLLFALLATALGWPTAAQAAAPTTTTLALSATTVASPAPVTLTVAVAANGAPLTTTGSVTFCEPALTKSGLCQDAAILGKAQLVAGTAKLKITPAIGSHTYQAVFTATSGAAASTSNSASLTVTGLYKTTTTVTAAGSPTGYDLTATVVGFASEPPTLSGSVSFTDTSNNNYPLGTVPLVLPPTFAQFFGPAPGSPIQTGSAPDVAGVGDFNQDGIPDLAIVNAATDTITVQLGNGDGTFTTLPQSAAFGATPCATNSVQSNCAIAVGDFNSDGKQDLVVTSGFDNTVVVLIGDGSGGFSQFGSPITTGFAEAVKIGDFNNDGILDLAVANGQDIYGDLPGYVTILLGNGDGTFTPTAANIATGMFPFFLTVADFNRDGNADLAVVNGRDNTISILEGDGTGGFTAAPTLFIPDPTGPGICPIVAADFNGDGYVDLAVAEFNNPGNVIFIFKGNGDGTFSGPSAPIPVGVNPFSMTALDFNGDGITDLAVGNFAYDPAGPGTVSLLIGNGDGTFSQPAFSPITVGAAGTFPNDVVTADFNGDGKPDLAIPLFGSTTTAILVNTVTQTATASLPNVLIAGAGVHVLQATYPANTQFAESSGTVDVQGLNVATSLSLTDSPSAQLDTLAVTFTAQLSPQSVVSATGTITFYDQATNQQLSTVPINAAGQAVYTTSTLGDGHHIIIASYSGDNFFQKSSSSPLDLPISDLQVTYTSKGDTTVLPGTKLVYTVQVAPVVASSFLYNVTLSTSGLPPGAVATFSPATLAAGSSTATVTMTVQTAKSALNEPPPSPFGRLPLALGFLIPLLGARAFRRRLQKAPSLLLMLLLGALSLSAVAGLSGCAGAGLFAARKVPYPITVIASEGNATYGSLSRTTEVPLAIQ